MKHAIHIISISEAQVTYGEERLTAYNQGQLTSIYEHHFALLSIKGSLQSGKYTMVYLFMGAVWLVTDHTVAMACDNPYG